MLMENKQYYYCLFDLCLLETIEFVFCNDIFVEYTDRYIAVYENNRYWGLKHPLIDNARNMAFREVADKC